MKGFPTDINENKKQAFDLLTRATVEGLSIAATFGIYPLNYFGTDPANFVFNGTSTPEDDGIVATNPIGLVSFQNRVGKVKLFKSITATCSAECVVLATYGQANGGYRGIIGPHAPLNLYDPTIVYPKEYVALSIGPLVRPVKNSAGTITNKVLVYGSYRIYEMSADMNYSAKNSIYILGDSNTDGSAIQTVGNGGLYADNLSMQSLWQHQVCAWYNKNGQDARIIEKAVAGYGTVDFMRLKNSGKLQLLAPPALIIIDLGTNDVTLSTFTTNMTDLIKYFITMWPNTKIILNGPIPKQNATADAITETIRTAGNTIVSSIASQNVIFINNGSFWGKTDYSQYSGTEVNGEGIHIGIKGHKTKADGIIAAITNAYPRFLKF